MAIDPKQWRQTMYGNYSAHFGGGKSTSDTIQFGQFEQIYRTSFEGLPKGPVLDLGCGRGEWLEWMKRKGWEELTGVDLSREDLEITTSRGFETHQSDVITFLDACRDRFAIIHAKDLVEHLDKNELVLLGHAALKALRPGGIFVASTFNAEAPLSSTTRYGDFTHESGLTRNSISQWLIACGFESAVAEGYHACPPGLKGQIRKLGCKVLAMACEFAVTLRHGKSSTTSCLPDLMVVARKR